MHCSQRLNSNGGLYINCIMNILFNLCHILSPLNLTHWTLSAIVNTELLLQWSIFTLCYCYFFLHKGSVQSFHICTSAIYERTDIFIITAQIHRPDLYSFIQTSIWKASLPSQAAQTLLQMCPVCLLMKHVLTLLLELIQN